MVDLKSIIPSLEVSKKAIVSLNSYQHNLAKSHACDPWMAKLGAHWKRDIKRAFDKSPNDQNIMLAAADPNHTIIFSTFGFEHILFDGCLWNFAGYFYFKGPPSRENFGHDLGQTSQKRV
jgi:hypothetical protein